MKTCTYSDVLELAGDLLSRGGSADRLPTGDAAMLRLFFASQLPDLWTREAWPETCDHIEQVTLDSTNCFSLREGETDEMGVILSLIEGGDPRLTTQVTVLRAEQFVRLDNRVNVVTCNSGNLWAEWQTPVPDLISIATDELNDTTLPIRFKLPLAALGAAHLSATEDPALAGLLRGVAESDLAKQAARITRPWWRR